MTEDRVRLDYVCARQGLLPEQSLAAPVDQAIQPGLVARPPLGNRDPFEGDVGIRGRRSGQLWRRASLELGLAGLGDCQLDARRGASAGRQEGNQEEDGSYYPHFPVTRARTASLASFMAGDWAQAMVTGTFWMRST